jgi:hypothetical protein
MENPRAAKRMILPDIDPKMITSSILVPWLFQEALTKHNRPVIGLSPLQIDDFGRKILDENISGFGLFVSASV